MRHNYQELIKESESELSKLEKEHRNSVIGSRLRFLQLLKNGEASTVSQAAQKIHYSRGHCQRWLKAYQLEGLSILLEPEKKPPGLKERMTEEAWKKLDAVLKQGEIASYGQARAFLAEQGIIYQDDSSVLKLFKRHQIKGKLGRPLHEKADLKVQEAFKKTLQSI